MEVVKLSDKPSLEDVVGRLRLLADQIESGEYGETNSAFVVLPRDDDFPLVFGYGDVCDDNHPIVQLELAKHFFINNLVVR